MSNALRTFFRDLIHTGHLVVRFPDGDVESFGDKTGPNLSIEVLTKRAARAIAQDPELASLPASAAVVGNPTRLVERYGLRLQPDAEAVADYVLGIADRL